VFDWSLNHLAAAGIEFEQLRNLFLRLRRRGNTKAGGTYRLVPYIGVRCNKLKQIERDILGAARCVDRFHEVVPLVSLSLMLMAPSYARKSQTYARKSHQPRLRANTTHNLIRNRMRQPRMIIRSHTIAQHNDLIANGFVATADNGGHRGAEFPGPSFATDRGFSLSYATAKIYDTHLVAADIFEPSEILGNDDVQAYIDFTQPVVPSLNRTWVKSPFCASVSTLVPECSVARRCPWLFCSA